MDWQMTWDTGAKVAEVLRHALPEHAGPDPQTGAIVAAVGLGVGAILALWGAKLLRFVYVAIFVSVGAYAGILLARHYEIDDLFGLVVGAAVAGLVGHLFFRWWVGVTTGVCAMLIAAAVVGPRILPQLLDDLNAFQDQELGVGSGEYPDLLQPRSDVLQRGAAVDEQDPRPILDVLRRMRAFVWTRHPQEANRLALCLALAWLAGFGLGVVAPRSTIICITSFLGVGLFAASAAYLLATRWPGAWDFVRAEGGWVLATLGLALIVSLACQFRWRRPIAQPAGPAPAA